jgi:hypothetical protein
MFFPDTGIPILKIARIRVRFAVWLPEPFTVAMLIEKSLTTLLLEEGYLEPFLSIVIQTPTL